MVTPVDSPVQSAEYPVEGPVRRHPRFDPLRRLPDRPRQRLRRGVYLIPSLFTLGNMFCGYLCVLFAIGGELAVAAPFIGLAFLLDGLDGRIARMTGTETPFGLELIRSPMSPSRRGACGVDHAACSPGRLGWAAGFIYVMVPRCGWPDSTSRPAPTWTSGITWACRVRGSRHSCLHGTFIRKSCTIRGWP